MGVSWQLTIDCSDPATMVAFWGPALDYVITPPPPPHATWNEWYLSVGVPPEELDLTSDGTDRIHDPQGNGPKIWFQPVPERKQVKNRFHLDLYPTGRDRSLPFHDRKRLVEEAVTGLEGAGATVRNRSDDEAHDHYFVVMLDPEGNEFCVA